MDVQSKQSKEVTTLVYTQTKTDIGLTVLVLEL